MIQVLEVTSEIAAGTRGASLGPAAIKIAALKAQSDYFGRYPTKHVEDENQLLWGEVVTPWAKRSGGLVKVYERVCNAVASELAAGNFPVILAGDHASAGGTLAGIKKANPGKRIGVIWIDAHADLHSPYTTPSGNMHGMPLATALNEDNRENQAQDITPQAAQAWETLKQTGGHAPKVLPSDIVFIAVRDTEEPEDAIMARHNIPNYTVAEVREKGPKAVAQQALDHLGDCDMIYVSYDVDSLDTSISEGTGTPVPNGLWVDEAKTMIELLLADSKACCFEIVEVNPCLDNKINTMAEKAFEVLEAATAVIEQHHQ